MDWPFVRRSTYDALVREHVASVESLNQKNLLLSSRDQELEQYDADWNRRLAELRQAHDKEIETIQLEQREWNQKQGARIAELCNTKMSIESAEKTAQEARRWACEMTADNQKLRAEADEAKRLADRSNARFTELAAVAKELSARNKTLEAELKRKNKAARLKKTLVKKPTPAKKRR